MSIELTKNTFYLFVIVLFISCQSDDEATTTNDEDEATELYFPNDDASWAALSAEDLNWNAQKMEDLLVFLEEKNSRGFIVLKDGKIAMEEYWGDNLLGNSAFDEETLWYWASAGKSLTSVMLGLAEQQGLLSLEEPISNYIGNQWSSLNEEQENAILLKHHLSFTTGIDYNVEELNCTDPSCLTYLQEPNTNWYYHNATYTILTEVIESVSESSYTNFTNENLGASIGLNGFWSMTDDNANVYFSTTKSAARFGLFVLAEGRWKENQLLSSNYYEKMIQTSQALNPSYGYLWWLNGQSSFRVPNQTASFQGSLLPDAPDDLILALGKNGQFIGIVPSQNLVIVRFGDNPGGDPLTIEFIREVFSQLKSMMNE